MRTAAAVRKRKSERPEDYCHVPACLWRTGGKYGSPCRKHPVYLNSEETEADRDRLEALADAFPEGGAPRWRERCRTIQGTTSGGSNADTE